MKRLVVLLSLTVLLSGQTDEHQPYFALSSGQTYATGDKPQIQVSAVDVADLDFRVYKINDPVKFFRQIPDPHQFGGEAARPAHELTLIEQFHQLKSNWHTRMRFVVRDQFTTDAWQQVRTWRVKSNENDRETGVTQYANTPVLNQQQLVATWRQHVKSLGRWRQQAIPVEISAKGVYLVEAVHEDQRAYTVLMISDMVLITKAARGRIVAYTVDRKSGNPISGATIQSPTATTKTDAHGLADIPVPPAKNPNPNDDTQIQVSARNGDDFTIDTFSPYNLRENPARDFTTFAYTDRPVYRPGHPVHYRYIVRSRQGNVYEIPKLSTVNVEVQGPDDKTIYRKEIPVSAMGTASGDLTLPKDAGLGFYSIQFKAGISQAQAGFEVQEYKKPEYDVRVTVAKARILQGEEMHATIDARYFFGEPVAKAKVQYTVHKAPYYAPYFGGDESGDDDPNAETNGSAGGTPDQDDQGDAGDELSDQEGVLDANGQLTITLPTKFQPDNHGDVRYRIEAKVTDPGNREVSGHGNVIATYGSFGVNIEPADYVVNAGGPASFKVSAFDYDGKPVQTKIEVQLYYGYDHKNGTSLSTATAQTGSDGHGAVSLNIPKAGTYYARAVATTPENRKVDGYTYVWASGSGPSIYGGRDGQIQIIPDKKTYQAGEVAKVLIITGVPDTKVLFSREGRALGEVKVIDVSGTSTTVEVPIRVEDEPDVFVSALFLKDNKFYQGAKRLSVPAKDKKLAVTVTSSKAQYKPGETGQLTVEAKDSNGKPVVGEFSVGVVDEALYGVRPDSTQDITSVFYGSGYNTIDTSNSMTYFFHGEAGKRRMMLAQLAGNRHSLAQLKPDRFVQPKVRKEFPDTALWLPAIKTGADGKGIANVTFPDSVTTWRTTTRGITADSKVGASMLKTIVRKNIILRMVNPRFFTQNDEVTISAVIHNYLINDKQARVSLDVKGVDIIDGGTRDIAIPSRGEVKVDWRVKASSIGDAVLTGKVLTDEESDAVEITLPVEPQGVKITTSRSGSQSGALTIAFPKAVVPLSRKLEISVSPSIAGALFGAIDYLTQFPYGCTEQTLESFVPNVVVSKALTDLNIKSDVNQQELNQKIRAGLDRLYDFQHDDGGWGWWKTDDSGIFMTTAAIAGLSQAKAAGVDIKPEAIPNAVKWLKEAYPKEPRMLADLKAYSIYALALAGDTSFLEEGWNQRSNMTSYGRALLGLALEIAKDPRAAQIAATLEADVKTNESEAWWPNDRDTLMDFYADTSSETTAFALKLLVHEKPQSQLLAKAAVYLMNHRSEGFYWYSTKQTGMVIYGLTDYLKATGELKPNLKASVTVNGKQVLTKAFVPADALAINDTKIEVPGADANDIKIESSGDGRLYWSVKQTYYSTDQKSLKMGNANLNILRDYFKLTPDKSGDKIVYGLDPLQGALAVGDVIAARITVTGTDWKYLLIEDPIPAGVEFIERDDLYELKTHPDWWNNFASRREFHDDRAAIFQTFFEAGQKTYFYLFKVVNPGAFKVSPASVQPMYQPDLLSTTENKEVVVK